MTFYPGGEFGGDWILAYVWLSPFTVHLKLSQHCLLIVQPVHSEGDQPWDFFGRNDAKAETPVLWPPHVKS